MGQRRQLSTELRALAAVTTKGCSVGREKQVCIRLYGSVGRAQAFFE